MKAARGYSTFVLYCCLLKVIAPFLKYEMFRVVLFLFYIIPRFQLSIMYFFILLFINFIVGPSAMNIETKKKL